MYCLGLILSASIIVSDSNKIKNTKTLIQTLAVYPFKSRLTDEHGEEQQQEENSVT